MKVCKSEHRMLIVTEAFIVVQTAEQAVDRLALLHNRATTALSQALKRYLKDRVEPDAEQRSMFRYPELRLTYHCQGRPPVPTPRFSCRAPTASPSPIPRLSVSTCWNSSFR
jgi:AMP nucleosidase